MRLPGISETFKVDPPYTAVNVYLHEPPSENVTLAPRELAICNMRVSAILVSIGTYASDSTSRAALSRFCGSDAELVFRVDSEKPLLGV